MVVQRFSSLAMMGRGHSDVEEEEEKAGREEQGDVVTDNLGQIGRWVVGSLCYLEECTKVKMKTI